MAIRQVEGIHIRVVRTDEDAIGHHRRRGFHRAPGLEAPSLRQFGWQGAFGHASQTGRAMEHGPIGSQAHRWGQHYQAGEAETIYCFHARVIAPIFGELRAGFKSQMLFLPAQRREASRVRPIERPQRQFIHGIVITLSLNCEQVFPQTPCFYPPQTLIVLPRTVAQNRVSTPAAEGPIGKLDRPEERP